MPFTLFQGDDRLPFQEVLIEVEADPTARGPRPSDTTSELPLKPMAMSSYRGAAHLPHTSSRSPPITIDTVQRTVSNNPTLVSAFTVKQTTYRPLEVTSCRERFGQQQTASRDWHWTGTPAD